MQTKITIIPQEQPELIDIQCHAVRDEVRDILAFLHSRQGMLTGTADNRQYEIPVSEILYIESIEHRTFLYTQNMVYETRSKLYVLEEMLQEKLFLRISKSMLLNLMKVSCIQPAPGARFLAVLQTGEEVLISRKYVPDLKKALKGD